MHAQADHEAGGALMRDLAISPPDNGRADLWSEQIEHAAEVRERMIKVRKGRSVFVWPRLWPRRRENHVGRLNGVVRGPSRTGRLTPR